MLRKVLRIKKMRIDTAEMLSLVDRGGSGDDETRPAIVLFKRDMKKMTDLGDFIARTAEEKGKTAEEIGMAAGIDGSTMGQIMRGEIKDPPSERISAIAKELNVPVGELTSRIPEEFRGGGPGGRESDKPQEKRMRKATTKEQKLIALIKKEMKDKNLSLKKVMGLGQIVTAIDEIGLPPDKRDMVIKLLETVAGASPEPEAPADAPELDKAEGDSETDEEEEVPAELEKQEGEDDKEKEKEMAKREKAAAAAHALELKKRDDRIQKLEDDARDIRLAKRVEELKHIPGSPEKILEMCKRADGDDDLDGMLTDLNKGYEENPLLKAAGLVTQNDENSPQMRLAKRRTALMDKNPEMSADKATSVIYKNDPELYAELKADQAAQH